MSEQKERRGLSHFVLVLMLKGKKKVIIAIDGS
jgi:hypothetical protein